MSDTFFNSKQTAAWICAALLYLAAGCSTHKPQQQNAKYIFYPPAPDPAKIQFLTSYSSEKDFRGGSGNFSRFVTGQEPPQNPISKPYGLAFKKNQIYVCDTVLGAVLILDFEKHKMGALAPNGTGTLKLPINISIDSDGTRYVADSVRNQVLIYDSGGIFQGAVGEKNEMRPRDVAVAKDRFYVGDLQNHCVRVYDKAQRKLLFTIPRDEEATNVAVKLYQPLNLAVDSKGQLLVSDTGAFRVQKYDLNGKFVRTYGQNGDRPGEFKMPKGVSVDREGRVYVVDAANQLVQIFDEQGKLLMWFGEPDASAAPLCLPAKVIVDYDHIDLFKQYAAPNFQIEHLLLVSNQFGPRKVSVYGFGHKK